MPSVTGEPKEGRGFLSTHPGPAGAQDLRRPAVVVLTVLIPFGCGYYLSYLVRTVNAVISPILVTGFGLTQADLGLLTGVYFITFAAMQLPLGVLLDRYGPRRVQMALLLIAALGSALFAVGESFAVLLVARGLIGAGVSGCLMASFKANAIWWPKDRLPLMYNIIAGFGGFGALSATVPVQAFMEIGGWRELFWAFAVLAIVVAAAMWLVVPERPDSLDNSARLGSQFAAFGVIVRSAFFWRIAFLLMACEGTYLAYQTLWAGPWLREVAGFGDAGAGWRLLIIQIGMLVGVVGFGVLADRLRHTRIRSRVIIGWGIAIYLAAQLLLALGVTAAAGTLWAVFGVFGTVIFLCFSLFAEGFPENQIGRVTTAGNLLIFLFAFATQWGVGAIIDLFPAARVADGHMTAFFVLIVIQAVSLVCFVWPAPRRGA